MFVLLKHDTMDCHSYVGFQFYFYQILWIRLFFIIMIIVMYKTLCFLSEQLHVAQHFFPQIWQSVFCVIIQITVQLFYLNLGYLIILANSTPFSCVMIQTTVQLFYLNLGYLIILANSTPSSKTQLSDCNLLHITHHTSYITTVRKPQILLFNSFLFGFCSSEYYDALPIIIYMILIGQMHIACMYTATVLFCTSSSN